MHDWAFLTPSITIILIKPSLSLGCIIIMASNWSLCKTRVRMVFIKGTLCEVNLYSPHTVQVQGPSVACNICPQPCASAPPTVSSLDSSPTSVPSLTTLQPCWPPCEHSSNSESLHLLCSLLGMFFAQISFHLPPSPHSHLCPNNAFLLRPLLTALFHISQSSFPIFFPISHMTSHAL